MQGMHVKLQHPSGLTYHYAQHCIDVAFSNASLVPFVRRLDYSLSSLYSTLELHSLEGVGGFFAGGRTRGPVKNSESHLRIQVENTFSSLVG